MRKKVPLANIGAVIGIAILSFNAVMQFDTALSSYDNLRSDIVRSPMVFTFAPLEQQETVQIPDKEFPTEKLYLSEDEKFLLAKIAMAEAEGEDTRGKALVIMVVLNRVKNEKFPDSIESVIYQNGQFSPILNGRFEEVIPNDACWEALDLITDGWDESQDALYFESVSASTWHRDNLQFLFSHGNHLFYTHMED